MCCPEPKFVLKNSSLWKSCIFSPLGGNFVEPFRLKNFRVLLLTIIWIIYMKMRKIWVSHFLALSEMAWFSQKMSLNVTKLYSEKQAISTVSGKFSWYWEQTFIYYFCWCPAWKDRLHNWDTILEYHKRLDKTMYSESSVTVCCSCQPWMVFWIYHGIY